MIIPPTTPTELPVPATKGRIVLVDDDPLVLQSLEALLMLETSYQVQSFNDPREALEALPALQPHVVISDFNMPHLTGLQLLRQLKPLLPEETAYILLTGYSDKDSAIEAINTVELYRYLEKPWDNHQLLQTIDTALQHVVLKQQLQQTLQHLASHNEQLEHKINERTHELQEALLELNAMLNQSPDGVLRVDATGSIAHVNPTLAIWLSPYLQEPLVPQEGETDVPTASLVDVLLLQGSCIGVSAQSLLPALFTNQGECLLSDKPVECQLGELWLEGRCSVLHKEDTTSPPEYLWMLRNITERKQLEQLRDDFMATLTHDLRTPLQAAIQTCGFFTQGILGEINEKQRTVLTTLEQSNRDMLGLVNTLLDVYRYEAGRYPLVPSLVEPQGIVEQVIQELSPLAQEREQRLVATASTWTPTESSPKLWVDKQELKRVMVNLISNAIRHTPKGGGITVHSVMVRVPHQPSQPWQGSTIASQGFINRLSTKLSEAFQQLGQPWQAQQPWWLLAIEDTGHGLSEADQAKLFHRFSQGSSQKRNSGSGLGLYLSSHILHQHGGLIGCSSTLGQGSIFFIALPQVV